MRFLFSRRRGNGSDRQHCAVFVVGCQRSGTTMLMNVFGKSSECQVYNEGRSNVAFDFFRLRSYETVKRLIDKSDKPTVVFKPVLDSQHTVRLLDLHPNAKAVWMYRDYRDVVNSSVQKWQGDQRDIMYGIAAGIRRDPKHHQYAISDRMSDETIRLVKELCTPDMSAEDGAALLWYVRNLIYFDLQLQRDPRVLLVKYEDLVTRPTPSFSRIFDFIGCRLEPECIEGISDRSINKTAAPALHEGIALRCREMAQRLDQQYSLQTVLPTPTTRS